MFFIVIGVIIYISFFVILPGIAAVTLRRRWEKFRSLILNYSAVQSLEYFNFKNNGKFSFRGKLESFKNDDVIWLKGESLSICINLNDQNIYTLTRNNNEVIKEKWDNITSLIEGTSFFVCGYLEFIGGIPYLVGSEDENLLVVIGHEQEDFFESLLVNGRSKNEMWNSYTPYAFITGVLILIILSYFSYTTLSDKTFAFLLLLAAGTPFYFIVPPGLFFYLKYRKNWDRSIRWAILKDLKKLQGNIYSSLLMKKRSKRDERCALAYYLLGYLLNLIVAGIILFQLFQIIIIYH